MVLTEGGWIENGKASEGNLVKRNVMHISGKGDG